jgi:hypothetical protein
MQRRRLIMLQQMPIFGGVDEATLDFILQNSEIVEVVTGDYFFREGDQDMPSTYWNRGVWQFIDSGKASDINCVNLRLVIVSVRWR